MLRGEDDAGEDAAQKGTAISSHGLPRGPRYPSGGPYFTYWRVVRKPMRGKLIVAILPDFGER